MDAALYFPYIEVPQSPALLRVLLYWDQLGTIVPPGLNSRALSPGLRTLLRADLVRRVAPADDVLRDGDFPIVVRGLIAASLTDRRRDPNLTTLIHNEKADDELWRWLEGLGMANRGWPWVEVDEEVAGIYMWCLAGYLGQAERLEPITDQPGYFAPFGVGSDVPLTQRLDRMRAKVLRGVLPAPSAAISMGELIAFRNEHLEELRAFRRYVEARILACAAAGDVGTQIRMLEQAESDLADEVRRIEAMMNERRWPTSRGMLCGALEGLPGIVQYAGSRDPTGLVSAVAPGVSEMIRALERPDLRAFPAMYGALVAQAFGASARP
jgi:hypothetical protein